jgi:uncharacterized membrane protein YesL
VTEAALPDPAPVPSLAVMAVLRDTARLYRDLFGRTVLTGLIVFGVVAALETVASAPVIFLSVIGTALVQGALVEAVAAEHESRAQGTILDLYRSAWTRIWRLLGVSLLTGLGVGLGILLLVVPGLILFTRWSLAVPVVMLEGLKPRAAMRRSRELVAGHGWAVFRILLNVTIMAALGSLAIELLLVKLFGSTHATMGLWVSASVASAITLPYGAHAMSVVYYRLTEPGRPVLPERESRWQSVWHEHERRGDDTAS